MLNRSCDDSIVPGSGGKNQDPNVINLDCSVTEFEVPVSKLDVSIEDLEAAVLDLATTVSDLKVSSSCESTDTTPRNSSSEDTSEAEEGIDTEMRWKKKGDHPEYSKEEFKEEYSRGNSIKTKSKRSLKKDKKPIQNGFKENEEGGGMSNEGSITGDLSSGCSGVVGTTEAICKFKVPSDETEFTRNDGIPCSGFSGGFFIPPPKPPRIQTQLSEPVITSHHTQPDACRPRETRSMSLPPVPPPKPRRSMVDDECNGAKSCLPSDNSHVTRGSVGYPDGSDLSKIAFNLQTVNGQPQSSQARDVNSREIVKMPNEKDSETPVDNAAISNNLNGSCSTEMYTSSDHPDHQSVQDMGNGDVFECTGGSVILRNKHKSSSHTEKGKDQHNGCSVTSTSPTIDEIDLDDGLLRDDITGDSEGVAYNSSHNTVNGSSVSTAVGIGSDEEENLHTNMDFRGWTWVYIGDDDELLAKIQLEGQDRTDTGNVQDMFNEDTSSVSTTASEKEFKIQVQTSTRIHRKTSEIDYQRVSMFNTRERDICLKKKNNVFGFRIQRSRPVVVTEVDKGGAAEEAGIKVGDVILSLNGHDVSNAAHSDVVKHASSTNENDHLTLVVGTNVCNSLNLRSDQSVMSGYMYKRGGSGLLQTWKKRWFVLKHDNCLYYYKTSKDVDPLGAIVLANYTVVKAWDLDKPFAFKLSKFKARTYYFHTTSEEERTKWASAITDATNPTIKSNIWMGISTHNVSIPALSISNPECIGYLTKRGDKHKTWRRRFFVLKDACMYYYENNSSAKALGVVHFHGYTIQEIRTNSKKFPFDLIPPEPDLRTYHFLADHETDRKRWVAALASSIGKWVRTDVCNSDDEEGTEMLI
ncbi:uncharacterized protein LOC117125310 isoform X2 [Anneissia japonica]|nr:uncharacterized protein LOC117125310 isoform X2 [Anneissia japonica]XP_033127669.1 uncharacterized protein LOC117125310 isoform X2 [Anneissia japonica]